MRRRAACASHIALAAGLHRCGGPRARASGRHRRRSRHSRRPRSRRCRSASSRRFGDHEDDERRDRRDRRERDPKGNSAGSAISALKQWGVRTLGELAALPPADLAARLGRGAAGVAGDRARRRHASARAGAARGALRRDARARVADRGARVAVVRADAPARAAVDASRAPRSRRRRAARRPAARAARRARRDYARRLELPTPMRDVRTLRTLALLDLESHPPPGADRVRHRRRSIRRRGVCCSTRLFTRAHPTPEQLSTLHRAARRADGPGPDRRRRGGRFVSPRRVRDEAVCGRA